MVNIYTQHSICEISFKIIYYCLPPIVLCVGRQIDNNLVRFIIFCTEKGPGVYVTKKSHWESFQTYVA